MTHFDFKTLLPALLQVEDRVSMAHGLESRTPFVGSSPGRVRRHASRADVKFKDGELKHILKLAVWATAARVDRAPQGQDGLPGAANGVGARRAPRLRSRHVRIGGRQRDYLVDGF